MTERKNPWGTEGRQVFKTKGRKLTDKQIAFINEYMVDLNASTACVRAGYQTANGNVLGSQLLAKPAIKEEIAKRQAIKAQKSEVTAEYLIQKLIAIIQREEEQNPQAALRAIELAGKSIAMFKERQEISGPDGKAIEMEQRVSEDANDFTRRISELAKRSGTDGSTVIPFRGGTK